MIDSGTFENVYLGINLDTSELLAVKKMLWFCDLVLWFVLSGDLESFIIMSLLCLILVPALIGSTNATWDKAQKRYLGTVREKDTLNILLDFIPHQVHAAVRLSPLRPPCRHLRTPLLPPSNLRHKILPSKQHRVCLKILPCMYKRSQTRSKQISS